MKLYDEGGIRLYHGDCREITNWLAADVLATDPPYGIDYNSGARRANLAASIEGDKDTSLRDWMLSAWQEGGAGDGALVFGTWRIPRPAGTHTRLIWDTKGALGMGDLSVPWKPSDLGRRLYRGVTEDVRVPPDETLADDIDLLNEERRDGRTREQRASGRGEPSDSRGARGVPDADSLEHEGRPHAERGATATELPADAQGDGCGQGSAGRPDPSGAGEREPERALQDADERALQPWRVGGRVAQAGGAEWWAAEPPVGRVAHGVPDRLDQLAALGNALVPQIAEWIGRRILEYEEGRVAA